MIDVRGAGGPGFMKKQTEQAMENKSVGSIPLWSVSVTASRFLTSDPALASHDNGIYLVI